MSLYSRSAAALLVSLRTFVQVGRVVAARGLWERPSVS
jgi:hypothetical protein